jgi:hypothetical protein
MKKRNGVEKNCLACETLFYVPRYRENTAKFCSFECQNHKQYTKYEFTCLACNKKVITSPSRKNYKKKFCSIECREHKKMDMVERRRKQKAIVRLSRGTKGSRTLRKDLFAIREPICAKCGYSEYDFCLDIHHIDENANNNKEDNLIILCCMCHKKLHKGVITI